MKYEKKTTGSKARWCLLAALLSATLFGATLAEAAPTLLMSKAFGGSAEDRGVAVVKTKDGGSIFVGGTKSAEFCGNKNKGDFDVFVNKLDVHGALQWSRLFGGSGKDGGYQVVESPGGGYLVLAYTESNDGDASGNHGNGDAWLLRLDEQGNILWKKTYGGEYLENIAVLFPTEDGGYVLAGDSDSEEGDLQGVRLRSGTWVFKIDAEGNFIWKNRYGSGSNWFLTMSPTRDGGFVASGYTATGEGDVTGYKGDFDLWLFKIDAGGKLLWQRCLGGSKKECVGTIAEMEDGGYLVAAQTDSYDGDVVGNTLRDDVWLVKLDPTGQNIEWQKFIGGDGSDKIGVIDRKGDTYYLTGYTTSNSGAITGNHGGYDALVLAVDGKGDVLWQKCFGGTGGDIVGNTFLDGTILYFAGAAQSGDGDVPGNAGERDAWVCKVNLSGGPAPTGIISGGPSQAPGGGGGGGGGGCNAGLTPTLILLGLPLLALSRRGK